jgi:hypothetical protein
MDLKIENVGDFTNTFLSNISKLSESCILKFEDGVASCIISNNDNTIINFSNYKQKTQYTEKNIQINIPDVKKLIKIFQCLADSNVKLELNSNNIAYTSKSFKFKFHLLDDGIIASPKINVSKISSLEFNTQFNITKNSIVNILKASSIALDVSKLYIFSEDGIFCDFTDNSRHNVDSIAFKISDVFMGTEIKTPVPINFDVMRIISSIKSPGISVKYNNKLGTFLFELEDSSYTSKYIVSALVS